MVCVHALLHTIATNTHAHTHTYTQTHANTRAYARVRMNGDIYNVQSVNGQNLIVNGTWPTTRYHSLTKWLVESVPLRKLSRGQRSYDRLPPSIQTQGPVYTHPWVYVHFPVTVVLPTLANNTHTCKHTYHPWVTLWGSVHGILDCTDFLQKWHTYYE